MQKTFISAEQLERHSWELAVRLHQQEQRFEWIVGVARGGAQISIYMQEALCLLQGSNVGYAVIQAWSYTAIGQAEMQIQLRNLAGLDDCVAPGQSLLVVDDVFDRGNTLKAIADALRRQLADRQARIRLATLYYKPDNNRTDIVPDFFLHTCRADDWLVFPHELCGLSRPELAAKGFPVDQLPTSHL